MKTITLAKTAVAAAVAGVPLSTSAVQLEDYLIANSSYEEAFFNANLNASDSARNEQIAYDFNMNARYQKTFTTLPRSWGYTLTGFANAVRFGSTPQAFVVDADGNAVLDENGNQQTFDLEDSDEDYGFSAEGTIDTYFANSPYPQSFWFGQGRYETQDSADDDDVSATIGLGYGRVYNATPLAKVIRIVEELNEEGLLTGPIPDSVALEAAEIVDREDEFISKFGADEYRRDYYAAIEAALARSGAIRDGKLGALGALTMDEILEDEPISVRKHGWTVRVGAGFQASDLSGLADNDPKLFFQWEYARPTGYKGQFINLLTYEPVFGDETTQVIRNSMSYTYEMSDRIDWINTWDATYRDGTSDAGIDEETIIHQLSSSYLFHLNNRLDYDITLKLSQIDTDPNPDFDPDDPTQPFPGDDPTIQFTMGFKYRLK